MNADLADIFSSYSLVGTSPKSTYQKALYDDDLSQQGDFTERSRKEINFHHSHSTDIAPIVEATVAGTYGVTANIQVRTQDLEINKQAEALLKEHSLARNFSIDGEWHRDERMRQIIRFETLNGGVLVRYHYNSSWKIPMRVELIPISKIDTSMHNPSERLIHGLQRNKYNKATHIYLFTDEFGIKSERISMKDIVFYYLPWMTLNQTLAVSRLVTILSSLDDIFQYTSSEIQSAIEKAKTGVFWHTDLYSTLIKAFQEYQKSKNTGNYANQITEAKALLKELVGRTTGLDGTMPIGTDDKITPIDHKNDSIYEILNKKTELKNTSSAGVSQVAAYKDGAENNYAGLQAIRGHDEGSHKIRFDNLVNKVIDDYTRRLFTVGVQIGRIKLTSVQFFTNQEEYFKWDILRTASVTLDASKEATARAKELASGSTTHNIEYSKKGLDWVEEQIKQATLDIQAISEIREKYIQAKLPIPEQYQTQEELDKKEKNKEKKIENN